MTITIGHRGLRRAVAATALAGALALAACGGKGTTSNGAAGTTTTAATTATTARPAGGGTSGNGQVLPVSSDPITNTATAQTLHIASVLVENNVDASGKTVDDHLEVALSNSGTTDLTGLEVFYTITDPTTAKSESYYTALPAGFSIPAGGSRTVHFSNLAGTDHFPVNQYSLYYTSTNALEVKVEVSATGAAVQTTSVHKDAGGAEVPD